MNKVIEAEYLKEFPNRIVGGFRYGGYVYTKEYVEWLETKLGAKMNENTFIQEYLDYCKIMKITPNSRDQMLFMGGWNCALIEQAEKEEPEYCDWTRDYHERSDDYTYNSPCDKDQWRLPPLRICPKCGKQIRLVEVL